MSTHEARMPNTSALFPVERIARAILAIRGERVMLSTDLAALYEVEPRVLIQAVKRNIERFPYPLHWVGWGRRMGTTMQRHRPTARRENHKLPAASRAIPGKQP